MPQPIRERVLVTVVSGVVSAAILGVLALALTALSDGRVVEKMGGLTRAALVDYAKKDELPDINGLATRDDIPDVSEFAKRSELSDLTGYVKINAFPDASNLLTTSSTLECRAFPREDKEAEVHQCPIQTFKLAEWCSGNCSANDARMTLCCAFKR